MAKRRGGGGSIAGPGPPSEEIPIDITVPRECIYQQFKGEPGPCPRCGGPLQQSRQSYLVATRRGRKIADSFTVGSDMGWFCTRCPTAVINPEDVSKLLQYSLPHWDIGNEFAVAGVINLDAVPKEKEHLPLGDDDNPIPLVEFTNISGGRVPGRPARRRKAISGKRTAPARQKRKKKKKRK
jgi:hypothetical protein